ncbi:hypothetical protein MTO96_013513 [Rhipicephalus appendiculatus]
MPEKDHEVTHLTQPLGHTPVPTRLARPSKRPPASFLPLSLARSARHGALLRQFAPITLANYGSREIAPEVVNPRSVSELRWSLQAAKSSSLYRVVYFGPRDDVKRRRKPEEGAEQDQEHVG